MKLLRRTPKSGLQLRLTAMIDVVFLLIVFFMAVSRMSTDALETLSLPVADQGKDVIDQRRRVVVNILSSGKVVVMKRQVEPDELLEMLRATLARQGADKLKCIVRTSRDAAFGDVQRVLGVLARAGIWRIAYSVTDPVE